MSLQEQEKLEAAYQTFDSPHSKTSFSLLCDRYHAQAEQAVRYDSCAVTHPFLIQMYAEKSLVRAFSPVALLALQAAHVLFQQILICPVHKSKFC